MPGPRREVEVGDAQLRSDIETLAMAGVIDNLTTEWPVPWTRILDRLTVSGALRTQPGYVVDAADRIRSRAAGQMAQDTTSFSAYFDATNAPEVVRGFDALGRQNVQTQGTLSWNGESTFIQLSAGIKSHDHFDSQTIMLDGTYIAKQIGGAAIYAGYMTHWWGPGWISALSMSNNAVPIPQIGISRIDTTPFKTRWLSWMGPWQAEFFLGTIEGDLIPKHTLVDGLRLSIRPLPGLDFAVERMDEACGRGHSCSPLNYFELSNTAAHPSKTNDQGDFDIKYSRKLGAVDLSAYLQLMNEDSNPFWPSGSSHLFGITGWVPGGSDARAHHRGVHGQLRHAPISSASAITNMDFPITTTKPSWAACAIWIVRWASAWTMTPSSPPCRRAGWAHTTSPGRSPITMRFVPTWPIPAGRHGLPHLLPDLQLREHGRGADQHRASARQLPADGAFHGGCRSALLERPAAPRAWLRRARGSCASSIRTEERAAPVIFRASPTPGPSTARAVSPAPEHRQAPFRGNADP